MPEPHRQEAITARERTPCVYIPSSAPRGTLCIGVTSDLPARIRQHRNGEVPGFSSRYRVHALAWYEVHDVMDSAIRREKALKAWKRLWKIERVAAADPAWRDLSPDIL